MSISVSSTSTSTSAASATAWLSKELQTAGVSAKAAKTAAGDLLDAAETSLAANPDESDDDFRAALDSKIDDDVKSGKLSQDDADKVKKALDQMSGTSDDDSGGTDSADASQASGGADAAQGGGGAGGAGGAGGSSEKTEVSRTVTVSGNTKTTVITYSDKTTETVTGTATTADHQKYDKKAEAKDDAGGSRDAGSGTTASAKATSSPDDAKAVQDYLAQTPPGTLFTKAA